MNNGAARASGQIIDSHPRKEPAAADPQAFEALKLQAFDRVDHFSDTIILRIDCVV